MESRQRCRWCDGDPLYRAYHDTEWGTPERDSRALFENMILESFQSGLSWITILRKRDNFRRAFAGFDPETIAKWGEAEVEALLQDAGIIRHRGKIEATIANARAWQEVEAREGFSPLVWQIVKGTPLDNARADEAQVPGQTEQSQALSKLLKSRGFRFFGPTTAYAFMQASGLVNDHVTHCFRYGELTARAG